MFLYVANWKMNFPFNKAVHFGKYNYDGFLRIHNLPQKKIILCTEFTQLKSLCDIFEKTYIDIGAQDCSSFTSGSYTGQVSAESLQNIGCNYCIVGHSEKREYDCETNEEVALKVARVLEVEITPILCVGEKKEQHAAAKVQDVLKEQLEPVFKIIKEMEMIRPRICIAYEPVWSIGTGVVPPKEYIEAVFKFIIDLCKKNAPNVEILLLYGGSIDESTAAFIKSVRHLNGFLIGGASLDFQKFEKIVKL